MGNIVSDWLILTIIFLVLLIVLVSKRKSAGRNLIFIDHAIAVVASVNIVCYIMYTDSLEMSGDPHSSYLYVTSIFVVIAMMRYLQKIFVK